MLTARPVLLIAATLLMAGSVLAEGTVNVPVLTRDVTTGEVITPDLLTTKQLDTTKVYASTLTAEANLAGMQAIRPLRAGQPVSRLHVKMPTDVSRNSTVSVVYRRPGLELLGSGQALEDGRIGQTIRVLNPESRATLVATVIASNQVEVK